MARVTRANVLRHRDFRLLFIGQAVSQFGTMAVSVAMAIYITKRTGSATDLGVILGAGSLSFVVMLVFGGVWADRLPRQGLIIVSDLTRTALHTLLGVLILAGHPAVWLIAVIEALFGIAQAFFQPAYSGLVPQLVPEQEITQAQALSGASQNLALVLGPALATVLVLTIGAGETFLLDASTFLFGAVLLIPVKPRRRGPDAVVQSESFVHELRAGFREVTSRTWVWATILAYTGVIVLAEVPWLALGPLALRDDYGAVGFYGVMMAVYGAGSVLASMLAAVWHPRHPLRVGLACGAVWAIPGLFVALLLSKPVLILGAFAAGSAGAFVGIWWETSLARHIPPAALSRVTAWDFIGSMALMPLGYAVVGPLANDLGVRWVLGVGSLLGALFALAALIPKSVRDLPAAPPQPSSSVARSV
jgi:MFS family permease